MGVQVGRPTVITAATVRKLEQAFRDGLNVSQACFTSGVGRTAYYDRLNSDEVFANKMELAQQYVIIKAKQLVVQEINDGNLGAAKWWLERKARDEFGNQPQANDEPPQAKDSFDLKGQIDEWRRTVDVLVAQVEAEQANQASQLGEAVSLR